MDWIFLHEFLGCLALNTRTRVRPSCLRQIGCVPSRISCACTALWAETDLFTSFCVLLLFTGVLCFSFFAFAMKNTCGKRGPHEHEGDAKACEATKNRSHFNDSEEVLIFVPDHVQSVKVFDKALSEAVALLCAQILGGISEIALFNASLIYQESSCDVCLGGLHSLGVRIVRPVKKTSRLGHKVRHIYLSFSCF